MQQSEWSKTLVGGPVGAVLWWTSVLFKAARGSLRRGPPKGEKEKCSGIVSLVRSRANVLTALAAGGISS
jgi:hypothetical protein